MSKAVARTGSSPSLGLVFAKGRDLYKLKLLSFGQGLQRCPSLSVGSKVCLAHSLILFLNLSRSFAILFNSFPLFFTLSFSVPLFATLSQPFSIFSSLFQSFQLFPTLPLFSTLSLSLYSKSCQNISVIR